MTDIVERLRSPANVFYEYAADNGAMLREAADEIERLRATLNQTRRFALSGEMDTLVSDEIERLREALQKMLDAVCGDFGFAAAVRADSGKAYPWHPLEKAEKIARAALGGKE